MPCEAGLEHEEDPNRANGWGLVQVTEQAATPNKQ